MALSPDGSKLYVALNGANTLGVIDTFDQSAGQADPGRQRPAPGGPGQRRRRGLRLQRGRPAGASRRFHQPVRRHADRRRPLTGAAATGTVSVVNLASGKESRRSRSDWSPPRSHQAARRCSSPTPTTTASRSSTTATNTVTQTFHIDPVPGATVGSYANAISTPDANHLLVSIGRDNAIAVYQLQRRRPPVQSTA